MEAFDQFDFVIPAYTRETMPLDRLLQYLREIGEVVGLAHEMHLVGIETSSTRPRFEMSVPVANEARAQASRVRRGEGSMRQQAAYRKIREMVRRDGGAPAVLEDRNGVILDFPPESEAGSINDVRQASTFDGVLLRVGGSRDNVLIQMQVLGGEIHSGFSAPRALAKQMASFLFDPVRVSGIGSWDRDQAGAWKLAKMLIQSFEPLDDASLSEVMARLRAAPVVWPVDADELMRAEREP